MPRTTSAARDRIDGICSPRMTKMTPLATNCTVSHTTLRRMRVMAIDWPGMAPRSVKLMVTPAATAARMPDASSSSAIR